MLPPPQFYELSRLTNFKDVDALQKFAADRSMCGSEEYLPHLVQTDDGLVSLLPGKIGRNRFQLESSVIENALHKETKSRKRNMQNLIT